MQTFVCGACGQLLFFENSTCLRCGAELGFVPDDLSIHALSRGEDLSLRIAGETESPPYRRCSLFERIGCNWLVPAQSKTTRCPSCALTQNEPPSDPAMLKAFSVAETAKRRLIAQLLNLGLAIIPRTAQPEGGLGFALLAATPEQPVTTGHENGLITLNLAEADNVFREETRMKFGEPYRTLLGHFRHEIGHYYWTMLVEKEEAAQLRFRELFGDERADYSEALNHHYEGSAPELWQDAHVSAYAAAHPWEDWAETFAHYLHIRDVLDTAAAFRVIVRGPDTEGAPENRHLSSLPTRVHERGSFSEILREWLPLTYALNAVNRSMGKEDLYPFVLSPKVTEKLAFVHDLTLPGRVARERESAAPNIALSA